MMRDRRHIFFTLCNTQYMPAHGLLHMASAHGCFLHDSCKKQHSHEHERAESTEL